MQKINRAQAFSPGSDLWVLHDDPANPLLSKLDWYLNFQITRARRHQPKEMPPQLRAILTESAMPLGDTAGNMRGGTKLDKNQPLLIRAGTQLPTQFVMIVPSRDMKSWSALVREKWQQMQKPKLRVFLPEKLTPEQFENGWSDADLSELSIV